VTEETRTDETRTEEAGVKEDENAPRAGLVPAEAHSVELEVAVPYSGATSPEDREWTHDPLERSFFGAVGRGYIVGIVLFGVFGFLIARAEAKGWGVGAAIGVGVFVAFWVGVLGAVVMIGRWAMRNEEAIRGNESGHGLHGPTPTAKTAELLKPVEPTGTEHTGTEPAEPGSEAEAAGTEADATETETTEAEATEAEATTERADAGASAGTETSETTERADVAASAGPEGTGEAPEASGD
jgi:hypothetical protein